jgi:hypothetical protein
MRALDEERESPGGVRHGPVVGSDRRRRKGAAPGSMAESAWSVERAGYQLTV